MPEQISTQRREFRVDRHALTSLIQAQAGSLQKAILEAVANALDAGASQIKVDLTPERVVIEDDGKGFQTLEEIDSFFDTFGFDHSQLDRTVGRFGVGRGQLFNFGKNLWTTHGFTMSVDNRKDGFGYDMGEAKKPHKGVKIEIDLYDPLSFSDLAAAEADFRRLVKFSIIPVIFNGKEIQKDPAKMKWDAETEDAWFKFDDSYGLKIYSQGLFVQDLSSHRYGKGGVVITKAGKALTQNMARNDMLTSQCAVWKRVDGQLKKLASTNQEKAKKSNVLTEAMRASLAKSALHDDDLQAIETLYKTPLFTLSNGKHLRLQQLLATGFVALAPNNDPSADLLIQRKQANCINPTTLHRFGVDNIQSLKEAIEKAVARHEPHTQVRHYGGEGWKEKWERRKMIQETQSLLKNCKFFEKVGDLPMRADIKIVELTTKEYSPEEKQLMAQIKKSMLPHLSRLVRHHLEGDKKGYNAWAPMQVRSLSLASSEAFAACTDGATKIWLERKFLKKCVSNGADGFVGLANTLVHELLHDIDTSTGHGHDHEFFETFHHLTVEGKIARTALQEYRGFLRRGGRAPNRNIRDMEEAGLLETDDASARQVALQNGPVEDEVELAEVDAPSVQPAGPVPRKPRRKM